MFKRSFWKIGITIILAFTSSLSFGGTTDDIYAIYGLKQPLDYKAELDKLSSITDQLFIVERELVSLDSLSKVSKEKVKEYINSILEIDDKLYTLINSLSNATEQTKELATKKASLIFENDNYVRKLKEKYETTFARRTSLREKIDILSKYLEVDTQPLTASVNNARAEKEQQISIVKELSTQDIGNTKTIPWPFNFPEVRITSYYSWRKHPLGKDALDFHTGLDFGLPEGTEVRALFNGVVVLVEYWTNSGWTLIVDHGNGVKTLYCHLSEFTKQVGDTVRQGDVIALSGNTGYMTTGPHLHLGMYLNGQHVDPYLLYDRR